jgi:hypothetical protein
MAFSNQVKKDIQKIQEEAYNSLITKLWIPNLSIFASNQIDQLAPEHNSIHQMNKIFKSFWLMLSKSLVRDLSSKDCNR